MVWFHCEGYSILNPFNESLYVNDWFETASAYTFEKTVVELEDDKEKREECNKPTPINNANVMLSEIILRFISNCVWQEYKNLSLFIFLSKKFCEDYYFDMKQFIEAILERNYESILEFSYIKP